MHAAHDDFSDLEWELFPQPVHYVASEQTWHCYSYRVNRTVLARADIFASTFPRQEGDQSTSGLLLNDPPRHTELRAIVNPLFTPKAVAYLGDRVRLMVVDLLKSGERQAEVDLLADVALPLAELVMLEHLGFPAADRQHLFHMTKSIFHVPPGFASYCTRFLRKLEQSTASGNLSLLLASHVREKRPGTRELIEIIYQLLVAGRDTIAHFICNCIYFMAKHPEIAEAVRTHPGELPEVMEEVLRLYPSFPRVMRRALHDYELEQQIVREGQLVLCQLDKANRDASFFLPGGQPESQPRQLRHLAFGYGEHYCIGAALARLEAQIALETIVERVEMNHVHLEGPPTLLPGRVLGLKRLLIRR